MAGEGSPIPVTQAMAEWTAPVGTKQTARQISEVVIVEERHADNLLTDKPIPNMLMGQERKNAIINKQHLLLIAEHETGHAIILYDKNLCGLIKNVSVTPNSQRLGEVSFYGSLGSLFNTTAAGGSAILGIFGSAHGYGSDLNKIRLNGGSVLDAQLEAKSIIKKYSAVIKNISEMLVLRGNVSGKEFYDIVNQAYFEVGLEHRAKKFNQTQSELITRIITKDQFTTIIIEEKNGKILSEKEFFHCPVCGGKRGHSADCIFAVKKSNSFNRYDPQIRSGNLSGNKTFDDQFPFTDEKIVPPEESIYEWSTRENSGAGGNDGNSRRHKRRQGSVFIPRRYPATQSIG